MPSAVAIFTFLGTLAPLVANKMTHKHWHYRPWNFILFAGIGFYAGLKVDQFTVWGNKLGQRLPTEFELPRQVQPPRLLQPVQQPQQQTPTQKSS